MRRNDSKSTNTSGLSDALRVARKIGVVGPQSTVCSVLKNSRKTLAVRIADPAGRTVILKRGSFASIGQELEVYARLRQLGGKLAAEVLAWDLSPDDGWIALEDLGDEVPSMSDLASRSSVGALLGALASASHVEPESDGRRTYSRAYFENVGTQTLLSLRLAASSSDEHRTRQFLGEASRAVERALREVCADEWVFSERGWVLCHGDVVAKNVRWSPGGEICLLDWEMAGTGSIAVDLGCAAWLRRDDPLLEAFVREVPRGYVDILDVVALGKLLRSIHAIHWVAQKFHPDSVRQVVRIGYYRDLITEVVTEYERRAQ